MILNFSPEAIINREYLIDLLDFGDFDIKKTEYEPDTNHVVMKGTWEIKGFVFEEVELDFDIVIEIDEYEKQFPIESAEDVLRHRWNGAFEIFPGRLIGMDIDTLGYDAGEDEIKEALNELELSSYVNQAIRIYHTKY